MAYVVCQHYGLDTSDYSFGYVATWSGDKQLDALKSSLETIRKEADAIITEIDGHIAELRQELTVDSQLTVDSGQLTVKPEQTDSVSQLSTINSQLSTTAAKPPNDTFTIYQLKRNDDTWDYRFQSLKQLETAGLVPDPDNYAHTYTAPLDSSMTLNKIYHTFNIDRPEDFKGHSLSVSDMVVLNRDGKETAFYVDSMGFQELPGFLAEKEAPPLDLHVVADYLQKQYNSVAAADPDKTMGAAAYSMTVKRLNRANERIPDDHSQLKALLSHAAQSPDLPTLKERMEALKTEFIQHYAAPAPLEPPRGGNVAAIEAKVKAGESINLSDLTGAIKADKQAARSASQDRSVTPPNMRKPSIRQQIAAGREQIRNERLTMKDERLEHNRQSSIVHRSSKGLGGLTNAEI